MKPSVIKKLGSVPDLSGTKSKKAVSTKPVLLSYAEQLEAGINHLRARDRKLAKVIDRVGECGLELADDFSSFEALCESIIYQQLSGKAAATIFGRFKNLDGKRAFPRPQFIIAADDTILRGAGLSRAKAAAIKDLSEKMLAEMVPSRAQLMLMSEDEIIERLILIRGIGKWTIQMLLMFQLGKLDVLPSTDLGVRKAFGKLYGKEELPDWKTLEAYGERWRPYRSIASWYLWRSLD
jgi:3-methyladenine DNA glycosylase/8-oxoguanine DNA glycosylase